MLQGSMVTLLLKCILFLGYAFNLKVCQVLKIENETFWHIRFSMFLKIALLVYSFIENLAEKILHSIFPLRKEESDSRMGRIQKRRLVKF